MDDSAFLITPEQFAEHQPGVVKRENIGTIQGGAAVLEYFVWFADILRRVENANGLTEAFLREALGQQREKMRDRINGVGGPDDGMGTWRT